MNVEIISVAEKEFVEAVQYYNEQSEGLGYEFALEFQETIERIIQYPEAWARLSDKSRRCRLNRFPYGIVYAIRKDLILIFAVMHLQREPGYWKNRIY